MGCENKKCANCGCDDTVPETVPETRVVYVERERQPAEVGFWSFFWGMALGVLFFGC
jgi:hypothetical protein